MPDSAFASAAAIYRQRFPVLYRRFDPAAPAATIGVAGWQNFYGSGEYIGHDSWAETDPPGLVSDACIGPQAHTRHFTGPAAPRIATALARWL